MALFKLRSYSYVLKKNKYQFEFESQWRYIAIKLAYTKECPPFLLC